ncbi:MAG: hypothetical protein EBS05_24620 [Proteobacteria bacterium]|nr:hypothetical protein [Pseudomonadota bacterium]
MHLLSMKPLFALSLALSLTSAAHAAPAGELEAKPDDARLEKFKPRKAPQPSGLVLKTGDRLAIIGDSITEQKMYSRIMETYLTVCVPELEVTVRQYGWGGETAPGFLSRMTNDCLTFKPTVATTCYGMNDHGYRAYTPDVGDRYRKASTAIVQAFKTHGVRVIQGSPGSVGWTGDANAEAKNLSLGELRHIGMEIADKEHVGFADVFWPMLTAGIEGQKRYAPNYAISGGDRVHPGGAGHLVMAYAFLKSLGLDGDVGTITVDLKGDKATATKGHEVLSAGGGEVKLKSTRYPYCATGDLKSDGSIRSGMSLVPFNKELNRLTLVGKNAGATKYKVTWGTESHSYTAEQLAHGVNLADDFAVNPFSEAFNKVDAAVAAKQGYETHQIKNMFHGPEYRVEPETIIALTEKFRTPLANAIKTAFVPVTHTLKITAE